MWKTKHAYVRNMQSNRNNWAHSKWTRRASNTKCEELATLFSFCSLPLISLSLSLSLSLLSLFSFSLCHSCSLYLFSARYPVSSLSLLARSLSLSLSLSLSPSLFPSLFLFVLSLLHLLSSLSYLASVASLASLFSLSSLSSLCSLRSPSSLSSLFSLAPFSITSLILPHLSPLSLRCHYQQNQWQRNNCQS